MRLAGRVRPQITLKNADWRHFVYGGIHRKNVAICGDVTFQYFQDVQRVQRKKGVIVEMGSCTMKNAGLIPIKIAFSPTLVSTFCPLSDLWGPAATLERKSAFR